MAMILLIEDNHDIAAMVGEHLEASGYLKVMRLAWAFWADRRSLDVQQ